MTRTAILHAANERGFVLAMGERDDEHVPARLVGAQLDFPVVRSKCGRYACEISWDLAERLAAGVSGRVVF